MNTRYKTFIPTLLLLFALAILPACSSIPLLTSSTVGSPALNAVTPVPQSAPAAVAQPQTAQGEPGLLAAYEGVLQDIYARVNPAVVAIRVVSSAAAGIDSLQQIPGFPNDNQNGNIPLQQALGSGFVWDTFGHIVTNNHVVENAQKIEVTFSDGTTVPANLVGADPDSDLAVIKVDMPADQLTPVQLADSTEVKVGQLAIAIGNPFGLENTMTVGIISALGRTLPAGDNGSGTGYSIPEIIQTDAPINPGNSGGVLVDAAGLVVGVPSAIESTTQANAGIGFVIPSQIVSQVVPVLIKDGRYQHSWLGISGASLTPDLATAMKLDANQRGILVAEVISGSPAEKAGLRPSQDVVTVDGQQLPAGGDLITSIDGQETKTIEDLIAYLAVNTQVGQKATLSILRDGKVETLEVTLAARPTATTQQASTSSTEPQATGAYLGIKGIALDSVLNDVLGFPTAAQGLLIQQVDKNSPADNAGLRGSTLPRVINGKLVLTGGDVLVGIDNQVVATENALRTILAQYQPGDQVNLTLVRDGSQLDVTVTLAARSN